MKILQIYNIMPHYRSFIYQLIDRQFDCDFVTGQASTNIKTMDFSVLKGRVEEVDNIKLGSAYYQAGVPFMIRRKYDIFLITGDVRCVSTWLFAILAKLYPNKKVFFWSHGWLGKENPIKRLFSKVFFSLANGVFVYNERSRQLMINGGFPSKKIITIYNSLDYDTQVSIRKTIHRSPIYEDHFGNTNPVIIFIGRLTRVKCLGMIIDAVKRLRERGEFYNVVFIGEGPERKELEKKTELLLLSNAVWFYGESFDESENAILIYNATICVSPGNVGLTAIHCLTYGCPVITHDNVNKQMPEYESIIESKTGSFFKEGNIQSLAESISSWSWEHKHNRNEIRQNCYKTIDEKWNPHKQISIIKRVFDDHEGVADKC